MAFRLKNEALHWQQMDDDLPVWSRKYRRNTAGHYRNQPLSKLNTYDIEIEDRLWSLWGSLHPEAPVFPTKLRGRQYLAIYVVACCAASVFPLMDWSIQLLDSIVVNGNRYFDQSIDQITTKDYEFSIENLNIECSLDSLKFVVHVEQVCSGKLYCMPTFSRMNLSEALSYFFAHHQFGIVRVRSRALAIGFIQGLDGGYFMYDCQEKEQPLFPKDQASSYLLRTLHLQVLLYCIVVTLRIPCQNIPFSIYKVDMLRTAPTDKRKKKRKEKEDPDKMDKRLPRKTVVVKPISL